MGSLCLDGPVSHLLAPTDPGLQPWHAGGEMVLWERKDQGRTWRRAPTLTADSPRNHTCARRPLNAASPFLALWPDGDPTRSSPSCLYVSDGPGGHVWRLPCEMPGAEAPLELVPLPAGP